MERLKIIKIGKRIFAKIITNRRQIFALFMAVVIILSQSGIIFGEILPHNAQVVYKPAIENQMDSQRRQVPVVRIVAPNANGLSHNKYDKFNVDAQGAVINNSVSGARSQILDREISGNTNFTGDAARIILNEVAASNLSVLRGSVEIVGQRADFVLANPYGILVNGARFINTGQISLVSARPSVVNGQISGYSIDRTRSVEIGVGGMQALESDVEIVSRYVKISGQLKAKKIEVKAGNQEYDNESKTVISQDLGAQGEAVMVEAAGSMYGDKIKIVSSENGFGVKTQEGGKLISDVEDIVIKSKGDIENRGAINAKTGIDLQAGGKIANTNGLIKALGDMVINAREVVNENEGSAKQGQINAKNIKIEAAALSNKGSGIIAERKIDITATGDIINEAIENGSGFIEKQTIGTGSWLEFAQVNDRTYETGKVIHTARAAKIEGNEVSIVGRDISNTSSRINGKTSLEIRARDLTNKAIMERGSFEIVKWGYTTYEVREWYDPFSWGLKEENEHHMAAFNEEYTFTSKTVGEILGKSIKINLTGNFAQDLTQGAVIRGQDNEGRNLYSIVKGRQVEIKANNISNYGTLEGQESIKLDARGDIKNINGNIEGGDIEIKAVGAFKSEKEVARFEDSYGAIWYSKEIVNPYGEINARESLKIRAGSLSIKGMDVTIESGKGDIYGISAANLLGIVYSKTWGIEANGDRGSDSQDFEITGRLKTLGRGNLYIFSGLDIKASVAGGNGIPDRGIITQRGFDIIGAANITYSAKDIVVGALEVKKHTETHSTQDEGTFGDTTEENSSYTEIRHIGSKIETSGKITMNAGNNIIIEGSSVESTQDGIVMKAWGDILVLAAQDSVSSQYSKMTTGSLGLSSEQEQKVDAQSVAVKSAIKASKDLEVEAKRDITIVGGDIKAGANAIFDANNINVINTQDSEYHYYMHEEKSLDITSALGSIGDFFKGLGEGQAKLASIKGEMTSDENETTTSRVVSSNIDIVGNLTIRAKNDVNVIGSNIIAGGVDVSARDINVLSAEEKQEIINTHKEASLEISVGITNAYVDAYRASDALVKAGEMQAQAEKELSRIEALHAEGKASDEALEDARRNVDLARANIAAAGVNVAASIASAAGSAKTAGFNASVTIDAKTQETTRKESSISNIASQIVSRSGDIILNATNNINQTGSAILSEQGNIAYNAGNDIIIKASKDVFKSQDKSEEYTASLTIGTGGVSASAGFSLGGDKTIAVNYNNAISQAMGNITYKAGGSMLSSGHQSNSGTLDIEVAGNLKVESKQNTVESNSSSIGANAGYGSGGASAGINYGQGETNKAWVEEQTGLLSSQEANIKVSGDTHLAGAAIGSVSENKTIFNTGTITYEDIKDRDYSSNSSFGMSVSITDIVKDKKKVGTGGKLGLTLGNQGNEKEQINKATIGSGQSNQDLSKINRDTDNSQQTTREQVTGALNADVSIDLRLLSKAGRDQIVQQVMGLGMNTAKSLTGITGTIYNTAKTAYDIAAFDKVGIFDIAEQWQANQSTLADMIGMNKKVINNLSQEKSLEEIEQAANGKAKVYYDETVYMDEETGEYYQRSGKHDNDTGQIYLNAALGTATDTGQFINIYGHENAHNYTANDAIADNTGNYANAMWGVSNLFSLTSVNTSGGATASSWYGNNQSNNILQNNSFAAAHIENASDARIKKRPLDIGYGIYLYARSSWI
ncbi:MAG: hemagglutinin repeat-containing protein [Elusimicrobiota bacterium]|jgi:filamentous hemagglutinin|nr:hemagglutinin repeat-containing protein [Elusimicrobiota bacterium]